MDDDLLSLMPKIDLTRRGFVVASLATGFALAVQPVSAATITTDSEGLTAGEVKVPVADGEIPAYRAMPAKGGPFPTVLVVQEIFGVHEHIKDVSCGVFVSPLFRPVCVVNHDHERKKRAASRRHRMAALVS